MRRRRSARIKIALATILAGLLHPLMAGYTVAAILTLIVTGPSNDDQDIRRRNGRLLALLAATLTVAAIIQTTAPPESPTYIRIAMTRYYWFPFRWETYEQIGLIAPLALLAWLRGQRLKTRSHLAHATIALGLIAIIVAGIFCRAHLATHAVARLQPLRAFQIVYLVMILLLGAWLGDHVLKSYRWRWTVLLAGMAALMFTVARATYPGSAQVELPFGPETRHPHNPWERAFLWSAQNTPKDALFALDAHYITRDGEDAQLFRALARRSALPDYSKDGGEASITPSLTDAWALGQQAQTNLDHENDSVRSATLEPLGVSWIVLKAQSQTTLSCPYRNESAKVCSLNPLP